MTKTLDTCGFFVQLRTGHWAGDSINGWLVTIEKFTMGETPEKFKHEPAREATFAETRWLDGFVSGQVEAQMLDTRTHEPLGNTLTVPLKHAIWDEQTGEFFIFV